MLPRPGIAPLFTERLRAKLSHVRYRTGAIQAVLTIRLQIEQTIMYVGPDALSGHVRIQSLSAAVLLEGAGVLPRGSIAQGELRECHKAQLTFTAALTPFALADAKELCCRPVLGGVEGHRPAPSQNSTSTVRI